MIEKNWLIRTKNNHILGPVSKQKIKELIDTGSIKGDDEVCSGNGYWIYIREAELLDKYINGDFKQDFNPVQEAELSPMKVIDNENINLPEKEDLEYPEEGAGKSEEALGHVEDGHEPEDITQIGLSLETKEDIDHRTEELANLTEDSKPKKSRPEINTDGLELDLSTETVEDEVLEEDEQGIPDSEVKIDTEIDPSVAEAASSPSGSKVKRFSSGQVKAGKPRKVAQKTSASKSKKEVKQGASIGFLYTFALIFILLAGIAYYFRDMILNELEFLTGQKLEVSLISTANAQVPELEKKKLGLN